MEECSYLVLICKAVIPQVVGVQKLLTNTCFLECESYGRSVDI